MKQSNTNVQYSDASLYQSPVITLWPSFFLPLCLAPQGKEVSQESVKQFYENWISRQNTLSSLEGIDDVPPSTSSSSAVPASHHAYSKLKNQASKVSWGSSFSRWVAFLSLSAYCVCKVRTANNSSITVFLSLRSSTAFCILISSCMTDETMLCSRQPTQEELDEPPVMSPAADQLRRRLVRTARIDLPSTETDELSPR